MTQKVRGAMRGRAPYVAILLITLVLRIATALPLQQAGYMDASYTLHVAENLVAGRGLNEEILWNFMDQPAGLPHPSNLYWMPLPSFLIVPFYLALGTSYHVAQIPFVFLSLFLPLLSFHLSRRVFGRDDYAWGAAVFTGFSGFYTVYWVSPDNFSPFGLTASLFLIFIALAIENGSTRLWVAAGALAGLSHLARADGVLLLAVAPLALVLQNRTQRKNAVLNATAWTLVGYLVVMSPWFLRNWIAVGSPYPSAGAKTLWLTGYDELFRYADDLTPQRYLDWGVASILGSKALALVRNLFIVIFGDLQVFLAPFSVLGLWSLRRRREFQPFFVYAAVLFAAMTMAFTFPSWRGSMLHSATALLPFFAVAAPPGIDQVVQWVARHRRTWNAREASRVFQMGFCGLAILISLFMYSQGIFGSWTGQAGDTPLWNERDAHYVAVADWLSAHDPSQNPVMVVDPPSFYQVSHRRAVMIPTDGMAAVLEAARRYGVRLLILEFDHPRHMDALYRNPIPVDGLKPVSEFRDALDRPVMLFEVNP